MKIKTTNIRHHIAKAIGATVFLSVFILNVSVFTKSNSPNDKVQLHDLFLQASADDDSGSGDPPPTYRWSSEIACGWVWEGEYRVCNSNGSGNTCTDNGSTTCTCGKTC